MSTEKKVTLAMGAGGKQTAELIDYYRGNGVLKDVKADVDKNETAEAIRSLL